jgi:hypothetical protein
VSCTPLRKSNASATTIKPISANILRLDIGWLQS